MSNPTVFFDITAGGSPLGRIEMVSTDYDTVISSLRSFFTALEKD